ncbi:hypothetical protein CPB86DRAFT_793921 [Serendipita vermifera]|nr:hypothetical protein CPB86DRAFT_793921 [Serendipita vermifera]
MGLAESTVCGWDDDVNEEHQKFPNNKNQVEDEKRAESGGGEGGAMGNKSNAESRVVESIILRVEGRHEFDPLRWVERRFGIDAVLGAAARSRRHHCWLLLDVHSGGGGCQRSSTVPSQSNSVEFFANWSVWRGGRAGRSTNDALAAYEIPIWTETVLLTSKDAGQKCKGLLDLTPPGEKERE